MKTQLVACLCVCLGGPARAQSLQAGMVVDSFEMVPDRTVIFAPQDDGRLRIVRVTDKDRLAPMPRNPGEVAIAMTYGLEIGAVIEFNSGLPYAFSYVATASGAGESLRIPTCPVRAQSVAAEQWPEGFKAITVSALLRIDGPATCPTAPG